MKKRFFKIAKLTFMLSLSLIVLTCCSFSSQKEKNSKITLNFFNQKPEITAQYQKLARMYHAKHSNVNIQITTSGQGGGAAALQAKFASGEAQILLCLAGYLK